MKLYHRVSRFLVRRNVSRWAEKHIRWALALKPGTLINDCTGFNVPVISQKPVIHHSRRGWYVLGVDITVGPNEGRCSLMHCGVEPAKSRYDIESYIGDYLDNLPQLSDGGRKMLGALESGSHICDERGVLLQEFR